MYILIVARGYPSDAYKRNGIFEFDQARALAKLGHKVVYAAVDMRSIRRKRKMGFESLKKEDVFIEAINIPIGGVSKSLLRFIRSISLNILYKKIKKVYGKPDVIHAHFIDVGYTTVKVLKDKKIPIVLTEHFSGMNKELVSREMSKLGNFTYTRVNKLISVSEQLAVNIEKNFNVKSTIIPNIVDLEKFNYKENKNNAKESGFNFVSTGNLVSNKRMGYLIEAFYKAFKNYSDVKLYIFGEGPEEPKLRALINKYQLENHIHLMGQVDRKCIAEKMEVSDCFVLASSTETFGVAYIEAMAMGLPVIATKCGGPESFINDKNGILVSLSNIDELENAMIYMYKNINKYDSGIIARKTQMNYSSFTIAKSLSEIYLNIQ